MLKIKRFLKKNKIIYIGGLGIGDWGLGVGGPAP